MPHPAQTKQLIEQEMATERSIDSGFSHLEDFLLESGDTVPAPWRIGAAVAAAGSPVTGYVDDAAGGQVQLIHDNTSEEQILRADWGDQLMVPLKAGTEFECRVKVNYGGTSMAASERVAIGLASAYNATIATIAHRALLVVEDGTTVAADTDDATTVGAATSAVDLEDGVWHTILIRVIETSRVQFFVDDESVAELDMSDIPSGAVVQPAVYLQRDSGTTENEILVDAVRVSSNR